MFPRWEVHKSLGICVSWVGEHISLGICVSQVGKHISQGICVSQIGEHISPGIFVSYKGEIHFTMNMWFSGRGRHITTDVCFPGWGTDILGRGTQITRNMCFSGRETHITRDMCLLERGNTFYYEQVFSG